jgi:hypothetical protein
MLPRTEAVAGRVIVLPTGTALPGDAIRVIGEVARLARELPA